MQQATNSATLMKQGDYDALKEMLERELRCKIDPGAMSSYALCEAAIEKDFDSARKLCYQALKRDRDNPEIYNNLGKIFLLSGERGSAFKILSKGLSVDPEDVEIMRTIATLGIRRPPSIGFLPRRSSMNKVLGQITAYLKQDVKFALDAENAEAEKAR